MTTLLLIIIYIAFISLGLPDSILGSVWPGMYAGLQVPISYVGFISAVISFGTVISSMNSDRLIRKFGTGLVTAVSVGMTAAALFGFAASDSFAMLCIFAVPYGLGAGSVDTALNNFVALHYQSRHMSWLHCFWGIGATAGPYIMGLCLTAGLPWNSGYQTIGIVQTVLTLVLLSTLFLWKKPVSRMEAYSDETEEQRTLGRSMRFGEIIKIKGAKNILLAFFCYCALEATAGLWASSYMVTYRNIDVSTAAKWASLFYIGITAGRFLCGFVSDKFGDRNMVRIGQATCGLGILLLLLPIGTAGVLTGLILVGLGCAPIYPSLLHETPDNFGAENSQAIMGAQMACAYIGTTLMPPLFGALADFIGISFYPAYLLLIIVLMVCLVERMNYSYSQREKKAD